MKSKIYTHLFNIVIAPGVRDKDFAEKTKKINEALQNSLSKRIKADREYRRGVAKLNRETFLG